MELFKEILTRILEKEEINISFPNLKLSAADAVEMASFKALYKIKSAIENDSLTDFECMEEIVSVFEELGSASIRHDFG